MFTYLKKSGNMMMSLTDSNAKLASIQTKNTRIEADIDNSYTYLKTLATHTAHFVTFPF